MQFRAFAAAVLVISLMLATGLHAAPIEQPENDSRCAVCGMFVAKYPNWLAQVRHADSSIQWFDGVKDMLAYFFNPGQFGSQAPGSVEEIGVKDYYSLEWLDGRQAYYVTGSDVHGPMGHEFVPFASREAAEAFLKDHHGDRIWTFVEITPEQVDSLRTGHRMKGHRKGAMQMNTEGSEHKDHQAMHH
jgi:nitrous oxide reductase accessory protein NosL